MPTAITFGAMSARAFGFGGTSLPAPTFVVGNGYSTTGVPQLVSWAGAQAGDLAIIIGIDQALATPSGWTLLGTFSWNTGLGSTNQLFAKVLSSGDISAGSVTVANTSSGGCVSIVVYRGPTTATIVSSAVASATSVPIPGFTKASRSLGIVSYCCFRGTSSVTPPVGAALRLNYGSADGTGLADQGSGGYSNGATLTWSGLPAGTNNGAQAIELT